MKFGVREICDVVFKAKAKQTLGNRTFYKDEPVIYFDSLKTSTVEGAATTVYAQGGRGNTRLVAWEGERTVTFTMEDALISPLGFMILTGAGLVEAKTGAAIQIHTTDTIAIGAGDKEAKYDETANTLTIPVSKTELVSAKETTVYVMPLKNGEIFTEPFYGVASASVADTKDEDGNVVKGSGLDTITVSKAAVKINGKDYTAADLDKFADADAVLIDYYTDKESGAQQIEITADKFGGNYYIEASTLFRNTDGVDMPAEFIIPNAKVQSNFNFSLASSGDPSTFTFTMDAFPDYTRFDKTKKVLMAIQIIADDVTAEASVRETTDVVEASNA